MRKHSVWIWIMGIGIVLALLLGTSDKAFAKDRDPLVELLIKKGIITEQEVREMEREIEARKIYKPPVALEERVEALEKKKLPKWVEDMKWNGDLRLRNQVQWVDDDGTGAKPHTIQRVRYRIATETKLSDQIKVGGRFVSGSSGSGSARSTNQTLDSGFSTWDFNLDRAYATYSPNDWFSITGGKFKNPYYHVEDMLWDSDLSFEGAAAHLTHALELGNPTTADLFLNLGAFKLEDIGSVSSPNSDDSWLAAAQGGFETKLSDTIKWKGGVGYYHFFEVKGTDLVGSENTNTETGGNLAFEFNPIDVASELSFEIPEWEIPAAIFGNFVYNPDPSNDNKGVLGGLRVGEKKVKKKGQWNIIGAYRRLERDAWLDEFPDSDFHHGETNVRGFEIKADYAFFDNVILGVDYYNTERIGVNTGSQAQDQDDWLQTDVVFKF